MDIVLEMLERPEFKDKNLSKYDMLMLMYETLEKRYASMEKAVVAINTKYGAAVGETVRLQALLEAANNLSIAQANNLQLLANERNDQERRHARDIEEIMKKNRALEAAVNGNND